MGEMARSVPVVHINRASPVGYRASTDVDLPVRDGYLILL
jgi:hypothetical protein